MSSGVNEPPVSAAPSRGAFGACVVALALAGAVGAQGRENFFLVVGEIEIDVHVRRERDERDHVGGEHFFFDEFRRGIHAAIDLLGIHAAEIEEQEHEAAIARVDLNGIRGVEQAGIRSVAGGAGDGGVGCASGGECVDVFKIEGGDVLFFAVFGQGEVGLFQIADQISVAVARDDVDEDEFGRDVHAVLRLLRWLRSVLRAQRQHNTRGSEKRHQNGGEFCESSGLSRVAH